MPRKQLRILVSLVPLLLTLSWSVSICHAETTIVELKELERQVQEVVRKTLPCTVCLDMGNGSGSGVVVSADGLVLSAAHVTQGAKKTFSIIFPDGRRVKAKLLGAVPKRDACMAKIIDEGEYPFVPLGNSSDLRKDDWCVALGHPGGFDVDRTPPVRIGRVLSVGKYLRTDCAVMPGDSGGPLFDLEGRLIGIHSNIGQSLAQNNHVPVDIYRNAWDRMKKNDQSRATNGGEADCKQSSLRVEPDLQPTSGGTATALMSLRKEWKRGGETKLIQQEPPQAAGQDADCAAIRKPIQRGNNRRGKNKLERSIEELMRLSTENGGALDMTPEEMQRLQQYMAHRMERLGIGSQDATPQNPGKKPTTGGWVKQHIHAYAPAVLAASKSTHKVIVDGRHVALATAVSPRQLLTKASEIGEKPFEIELGSDRRVAGTVVSRMEKYDLALIRLADQNSSPIRLHPITLDQSETHPILGTFVAVVAPTELPEAVGVISVESRRLQAYVGAYLGIGLEPAEDAVRVVGVQPRSPASGAGLKNDDLILGLNDERYKTPSGFAEAVAEHKPGQLVTLQIRRGEAEFSIRIKLSDRSMYAAFEEDTSFAGGRLSRNRSGYASALQHDCPLRPAYCGGPLVNLDGEVIGINIARADRISSYAIPADVIRRLLSDQSTALGEPQTAEE